MTHSFKFLRIEIVIFLNHVIQKKNYINIIENDKIVIFYQVGAKMLKQTKIRIGQPILVGNVCSSEMNT